MTWKNRLKGHIQKYKDFLNACKNNRIDIYAACVSFYIFLSFIPFVVILLSIVPFLPLNQQDLETFIIGIIPQEYKNIILYITNELYSHSTGTLSISIIATVWAASRGFLGITKGLNEIFGVKETRNNFVIRVFSMFYTVFLIVGMIILLIMSVFGRNILSLIKRLGAFSDWIYNLIPIKDLMVLILLAILFLFVYTVLPDIKKKAAHQIKGACFSAIVWWGFSKIFEVYLSYFHSYSMYGSFAVLIIIGIWLYTGMYIMFIGAVLNSGWSERKENI